jgi:hypothetical protein
VGAPGTGRETLSGNLAELLASSPFLGEDAGDPRAEYALGHSATIDDSNLYKTTVVVGDNSNTIPFTFVLEVGTLVGLSQHHPCFHNVIHVVQRHPCCHNVIHVVTTSSMLSQHHPCCHNVIHVVTTSSMLSQHHPWCRSMDHVGLGFPMPSHRNPFGGSCKG